MKYTIILFLVVIAGCSNRQLEIVNIEEKKPIIMPKRTLAPLLINFETSSIDENICLNADNIEKFSYNYLEVKRYALQLRNENDALIEIIKKNTLK